MSAPDRSGSLDFLCISTTGWDEIWGSRQQIMMRLANLGHRVLFVERQLGFEHLLKHPQHRRLNKNLFGIGQPVKVQNNVWRWQPPLVLPGRYYSNSLNSMGQSRLASQIQPILKKLEFLHPILWLYPPQSAPLLGKFQERLSIYHCIERFSGDQRGRKNLIMSEQENILLSTADLVLVHSLGLQSLYERLTRHPIGLIPSAADVEHFQKPTAVHPAMSSFTKPRLVIMGTLDTRIDYELLYHLASMRPSWQIILIGPVKTPSRTTKTLLKKPNVHHLGRQPFQALPSLLGGADIGLIPYRTTEMTQYINPLKVYEYLACGIPVISTKLPELEPLSDWIRIVAVNNQDSLELSRRFIEGIEALLRLETPQQKRLRREFARSFSWDHRVTKIMELIWSRI